MWLKCKLQFLTEKKKQTKKDKIENEAPQSYRKYKLGFFEDNAFLSGRIILKPSQIFKRSIYKQMWIFRKPCGSLEAVM